MPELIKVLLPKLGESIMHATVVQWFKKVGDRVQMDEALLEVSTDKVNSEIPAPCAGILTEIVALPDQEIEVGEVLAVITTGAASQIESSGTEATSMQTAKEMAFEREKAQSHEMSNFFSPALLKIAHEKGINFEELKRISTTGMGGRLTKKDLENYIEKKGRPTPSQPNEASSRTPLEVERVKLTGMRKAIADNMVRSFYEAPHATLVTEVDVTTVLACIQKEKEAFLAKNGVKLTITAFIARAISCALREYPLLNSSLDKDTILIKRYVNLGLAVSVDQGILVPVIKNCQHLSLSDLAKAISELSQKARSGSLSPGDSAEGTITLTNFGMSGVSIGIPIIRYPEVAIVGIGAVQKKVVPLEEETIAVRSMVFASLTFDHRVLDGMYGCAFLNAFKKHMEHDLDL